jgi:hypothetical protein
MYITRLGSDELFSLSNKIHREVGRARDLYYCHIAYPPVQLGCEQCHTTCYLQLKNTVSSVTQPATYSWRTLWAVSHKLILTAEEHCEQCHTNCYLQLKNTVSSVTQPATYSWRTLWVVSHNQLLTAGEHCEQCHTTSYLQLKNTVSSVRQPATYSWRNLQALS